MSDHKTPALDYEAAKDVFFRKLEHDRFGRGRMESALFHTAAWIFEQGCHERDKLLAERDAIKMQRDNLLGAIKNMVEYHGDTWALKQAEHLIKQIEAGHA